MGRYVLQRIILALCNAIIIISITFFLVKLLPFERPIGDDKVQIAYFDKQVSLGYIDKYEIEMPEKGTLLYKSPDNHGRCYYYYQVPISKQYVNWLKNIVTKWDWGYSKTFQPNVAASVIIMSRLPYSFKINIVSVVLSVPLGILLGIWAALKKNTLTDHIISTMVMVFIAIPSFVLISFVLSIFAYKLQWLPSTWPTDTASLGMKVKGFIIPVFCASFGSVCGYCRFVRAELCDALDSEYLLLARTKGLTRRQAIVRHALKNAMVPMAPAVLGEIIGLFGGSMILEQLYGIPGLGKLYISALQYKDYDLWFVDVVITLSVGLFSGIMADLSYGIVDPRIRMGARK